MEGRFSLSNISNNENAIFCANSAIGIAASYSAFKVLPAYIKKPYRKYLMHMCKKIPEANNCQYFDKAFEAYIKSSYFSPKLQILDTNRTNRREITDDIIQYQKSARIAANKNNPLKKLLSKWLSPSEKNIRNKIKTIALGENACFISSVSKILVNKQKMGFAAFHEIGHYINRNNQGFKGFIYRCRIIPLLTAPAILATSLLTPKREEGDEYKKPAGKTATFIKEHCGILAGLSFLPIIAEEGVASLNAAKLAKKVLNKTMYKNLNKYNTAAFCSYLIGGATLGIATQLAVYIKDRISGTAPVRDKD